MKVVRRRSEGGDIVTSSPSDMQADSIVEYHEASKVSDVYSKVEEQSLLCGEVITIVDLSPQTHVDGW